MNNLQPIGVFDSGVGGLTVANALTRVLPDEKLIYFGDTAHLPYGDKSVLSIRSYAHRITEFLLNKGCKMIVIACNTASAAAYDSLQEEFGKHVPIIDVIRPLVNLISQKNYKKIGVIATKATIRSGIYSQQIHLQNPRLEVASLATPLLVPVIEEGFANTAISEAVIRQYLQDKNLDHIEALLLACTHYPLIKKELSKYMSDHVKIYDSTEVTALAVKEKLAALDLLSPLKISPSKKNQFFVSDYTTNFEQTAKLFYGEDIELEYSNIWQ